MNANFKGHEHFVSRMLDLMDTVYASEKGVVTSFLTLAQQQILLAIAPKEFTITFWGGYENAERKRAWISLEDKAFDPSVFEIAIIQSSYPSSYTSISHSNILGALMHAGLEREVLGDFLIDENTVTIITTNSMAEYVGFSASRIKSANLHFQPIAGIEHGGVQRTSLQVNCASLRMDAVVAALAHTSRSKAMAMIKSGLVKVNDVILEQNGLLCDNDVVSIRKTGRFFFHGVVSHTRKDRLVLRFEKYI